MKGTKVYISGPMKGKPLFNYPAFNAMAKALQDLGAIPINPTRHPEGLEYEMYMKYAFLDVEACDWVCLLPGWKDSPGAQREVARARELGKCIMEAKDGDAIAFNYLSVGAELHTYANEELAMLATRENFEPDLHAFQAKCMNDICKAVTIPAITKGRHKYD